MELSETDIVANGIKLHIYRTNTNKPPLLFAHGRSDNGLCFWPIAQQFTDNYEIILYDSRNHGQSEAPETSTTLLERAHDLAGLIAALGLQKPLLIGHSLGAITIALFAGLFPDVPGCAVLEDPPTFAMMASKDAQTVSFHEQWREFAAMSRQKSVDELVAINRRENPNWPEAERRPWALSKRQFNLNAFDEAGIDSELGNQLLSQIICPLLIITADLHMNSIFPPQAADKLVASLPNAKHVNIPGAGHNIRREQPDAFVTAVRNFLNTAKIGPI